MVGTAAVSTSEESVEPGPGELVHDDVSRGSRTAEVLLSFAKCPSPLL